MGRMSIRAGPPREKTPLEKVHSVVRWGKPKEEIESTAKENGFSMEEMVKLEDPQNGNLALHIAAQNGHFELLKFLLESGADINAQNKKGQTPLHMSVEYDFYFQTKHLLAVGADKDKINNDGHPAILGIDGGKSGDDAYDAPINMFKAATDNKEELEEAFAALEAADPSTLDQVTMAQQGMQKRKSCKENWDPERFKAIMAKLG